MSQHLSGVRVAEQTNASYAVPPRRPEPTIQLTFELDVIAIVGTHFFRHSELKSLRRGNALEVVCGTPTI